MMPACRKIDSGLNDHASRQTNMDAAVEQRLSALEHAVAQLQRRLTLCEAAPDWLDRVAGSITDDEAFQQVLAYGREFREADRPSDDAGSTP
jgi:hypothetical protein